MNHGWFFLLLVFLIACSRPELPPQITKPEPEPIIAFNKIGTRLSLCEESEDWDEYLLDERDYSRLEPELAVGRMNAIVFTGINCFRIGSDFSLYRQENDKRLYAKVVPTHISYNPELDQSIVYFDALEVFKPMVINQKGERLPTCAARFYDWRKYYLDPERSLDQLDKIQNGFISGQVLKGVYNCFRVGSEVTISVRGFDSPFGTVRIDEIQILHISELSAEIAALAGYELQDLKSILSKKRDRAGGYITLTRISYLPQ